MDPNVLNQLDFTTVVIAFLQKYPNVIIGFFVAKLVINVIRLRYKNPRTRPFIASILIDIGDTLSGNLWGPINSIPSDKTVSRKVSKKVKTVKSQEPPVKEKKPRTTFNSE